MMTLGSQEALCPMDLLSFHWIRTSVSLHEGHIPISKLSQCVWATNKIPLVNDCLLNIHLTSQQMGSWKANSDHETQLKTIQTCSCSPEFWENTPTACTATTT